MTLGHRAGAVTQADRLRNCYSDLHTGRFTVIADFEQTRQMELFHASASEQASLYQLSLTGGIAATGGRCLRAEFRSPGDELIAGGLETSQWNLPRDWRDYDLLLMSVRAPAATALQLSLVSGQNPFRALADSRIPLQTGWNLLRLDLADAAEHLALDDIRELRWSLPEVTGSTVLFLDDILLCNNRADLFGDSRAEDGGLYLRCHGRRWDIGAGGRFELGLLNGQIRYWYNLAEDRFRVRNLLEGSVLGPSVVALTGDEAAGTAAVESFPSWGERILARQRLLEASPVRMVVACEWVFLAGDGPAAPDRPSLKWTQTLYPNGELYVHVECTTETPEGSAESLGLAVSRRAGTQMNSVCHSTSQLGDAGKLLHVPYAFTCGQETTEPGLLFVVHDGRAAPVMRCSRDETTGRATFVAFGGDVQNPLQQWDCLLALGPSGTGADALAKARALAYCFPPTLSPSIGHLVTDSVGDNDHDGFNERYGCYVLAPDPNRVVLKLDGRKAPLYSPAFVIQGSAGAEAWVYVDYVVHKEVGRTADGEVLFQLPGIVGTQKTVEVYLRNFPE